MNNLRRACHKVNSRNAAISGVDNYKVDLNLLVFTLTPFIRMKPHPKAVVRANLAQQWKHHVENYVSRKMTNHGHLDSLPPVEETSH
jgi:hypothetical protein